MDSIRAWTTLLFQSKLADFRVSAKRFPTEFHSAGDVDVSEIIHMPIFFAAVLFMCLSFLFSNNRTSTVRQRAGLAKFLAVCCMNLSKSTGQERRSSLPAGKPRW